MLEMTLIATIRDLSKKMHGPCSASDLAAKLNLTPQHARRLIAPLLASGELVRIGCGPMTRLVVPEDGLKARLALIVDEARKADLLDYLSEQLRNAGEVAR